MTPEPTSPARLSLEDDLRRVLNQHSAEEGSDTPDYIMAAYLMACLDAFNQATLRRDFACGGGQT